LALDLKLDKMGLNCSRSSTHELRMIFGW